MTPSNRTQYHGSGMSQKPKLLPIMTLHVLSGINCRIHEKFVIAELQSVMMLFLSLLLIMVVVCWLLLYAACWLWLVGRGLLVVVIFFVGC